MDEFKRLKFDYSRRFGVEIELNSLDNRDFDKYPLRPSTGELPKGTEYIANIVHKTTRDYVEIETWHSTHNNPWWIVKSDSSCGIEVCSPILKGWHGLEKICRVTEEFKNDENIRSGNNCSFHVHVDVSDCNLFEKASILAYWIKSEAIFMQGFPAHRKYNRYCQMIGITDVLRHDTKLSPRGLLKLLGQHKYYSINTFHMNRNKRNTIEFRNMGNCLNPLWIKCWTRLIIHFVEMAKSYQFPSEYVEGDKWSSWCWISPTDLFEVMGFHGGLSPGMQQIKNWFLAYLAVNIGANQYDWQKAIAQASVPEINKLLEKNGGFAVEHLNPPNLEEAVYGDYYKM